MATASWKGRTPPAAIDITTSAPSATAQRPSSTRLQAQLEDKAQVLLEERRLRALEVERRLQALEETAAVAAQTFG